MKAATQPSVVKLSTSEPTVDPDVARRVGQEVLENRLDPATWATGLSASGGTRQDALAVYARLRIPQLGSRRRRIHAREEPFDYRRLTHCFGVKTVQDLLQRTNPGKQLNWLMPRLSVISRTTLGIGAAGCVGSLGRLLGGALPERFLSLVPLAAVLCGICRDGDRGFPAFHPAKTLDHAGLELRHARCLLDGMPRVAIVRSEVDLARAAA
jgi:hypothetical protein